ncbi:MAG: AAA family ATPase [Treponema sp.]|nr:AAA family ATPase [Treponema sp.]
MQCTKCNSNNRDIAKFCKKCGAEITQAVQTQAPPDLDLAVLDDLVGLDELKSELSILQDILEGMKKNQSAMRYQYNTIIIGASGTGKTSLIPKLIADLFYKYSMITKNKPFSVDGGSIDAMQEKDFNNLFSNAKGGMVFVDNAHKLVDTDGRTLPAFSKLKNKIDENKDDPIILLSGLPFGLREFVKSTEGKEFTGRFQKIFIIPDYTPVQLCAITEHVLKKQHGLTFSPEAHEQLMNRFRFLYKDLKKPDSNISAVNGYLAMNEANSISGSYYRRKTDSKTIIPQDIIGQVEKKKNIQEIMDEMNNIIGMDDMKKEINSLYTQLNQIAEMEKKGVKVDKPAQHFVIKGNPGTGKTTVARLLGNIFEGLGLLESGHVIEVDRSKLVAGFIGQTAPLTNTVCDKAMGGILFIDEVYTLKQDDNDKFGQECIDTLLKRMEDDRGKFMVVVAGYKAPMEKFLTSNEGLKSRFTKYFNLEDYNPEELTRIFEVQAKKQSYIILPETRDKIVEFFKDRCARKTKDFANGREARNLLDEARKNQADRLSASQASSISHDDSMTLAAADIPGTTSEKMVSIEEALKELNELTGLKSVKDMVIKIANTLKAQKLMGENEVLSNHFVFTGNPGTGKTTVARILGNVFRAVGLLPTNTLIETDRSKMIESYVGGTAPLVNKQCDLAMGGILFVDEAYSLKQGQGDSFGQEAVDTLLKRMEDDRGKFIVIAAGYSKEMEEFLSSNSGFKSRFSDYINFDDYNPDEMFEIFAAMGKKKNYEFASGFEQALRNKLKTIYASRTSTFANARTVRQLFDKVRENVSSRIVNLSTQGVADDEIRKQGSILYPEDIDPSEKVITIEEALKDLNQLEGLKSVKDTVVKIANTLQAQKLTGDTELLSKHFVFYGNPGTGKTTVARIMGGVFQAVGLLPTNKVIETDRSKMIAPYVGQTAPLVNKQCDLAMGGILFVDEAYSLKQGPQDQFGQEAVDALLKRMEDDRGKYVVIAAGYTREMDEFLASNSGFKSRFSDYLTFDDYNPDEMYNIFINMCKKRNYEFAPGFDDALKNRLRDIYASRTASFANARTVRQLFDKTKENMSNRVIAMQSQGLPEEDLKKAILIMQPEDLDMTVS